jgi:hypothetical protein
VLDPETAKLGMQVIIADDSEHRDQGYRRGKRLVGKIIAIYEKPTVRNYQFDVEWSNGDMWDYKASDLIPYEMTNETALLLLQLEQEDL